MTLRTNPTLPGKRALVMLAWGCAVTASGRGAESTASPAPTAEVSAYAAVGFAVGEKIHLHELQWTDQQFEAFVRGLRHNFTGGARVEVDAAAQPIYEAINDAILRAQNQATPGELPAPLRLLVRQLGLEPTDRGIFVRILRNGSGARPTPDDTVIVSIMARTVDTGEDVPALAAQELRTKVSDLIPGLAYGVQLLALEGHAVLLVPPDLAFGDGPWPSGVPRGSPLVFIVQLHDVIAAGTPPAP